MASIIDEKVSSQVKVFLLEKQVLSEVIEVETFVNSIDVSDGQGKEVVVAFTSQVDNQNTFVTDSNGLYFQERKINFRPSWDLKVYNVYNKIGGGLCSLELLPSERNNRRRI